MIKIIIRNNNYLFASYISRTDALLQGTVIVNWNMLSRAFTFVFLS